MKISSLLLGVLLVMLAWSPAPAQTGAMPGSARQAVSIAKDGVAPGLRDRIVSVYGVGLPVAIRTWWVIFYDPSAPSHGRAVKVDHGQITRVYEAQGGVVYGGTLTFARSQVTGEGPALTVAENYAAQHALAYDHVRALLRVTPGDQALEWRVQLLDNAISRGFVFVNASNGMLAMYLPPGSPPAPGPSDTGGVAGDAERAGNDIKDTFLGIGGDLQQFFTGENTISR